jgi:hypothetical protein
MLPALPQFLNLIVGENRMRATEMVDESPTCFATIGRVGPKSAWIGGQFKVDCRRRAKKSILTRD